MHTRHDDSALLQVNPAAKDVSRQEGEELKLQCSDRDQIASMLLCFNSR
jgi:hypothetical protein